MKQGQQGFTLLEALVTLSLLSVAIMMAVPFFADDFNEQRADVTVAEMIELRRAVQEYAMRSQGTFPGADGDPNGAGSSCSDALAILTSTGLGSEHDEYEPYLTDLAEESPWETEYETSCDGAVFTITVEVPRSGGTLMGDGAAGWANWIAGRLPHAEADDNEVSVNFGLAGHVPELYGLLHRHHQDDEEERNRMKTATDAGGAWWASLSPAEQDAFRDEWDMDPSGEDDPGQVTGLARLVGVEELDGDIEVDGDFVIEGTDRRLSTSIQNAGIVQVDVTNGSGTGPTITDPGCPDGQDFRIFTAISGFVSREGGESHPVGGLNTYIDGGNRVQVRMRSSGDNDNGTANVLVMTKCDSPE